MKRKQNSLGKKIVILSCDKSEQTEIEAFISRKRFKANEETPASGDLIDAKVIYLADVSADEYITYQDHLTPTRGEKKILRKLTYTDNVYIWGHGCPNDAYIPGAFYTEIANFLVAGINRQNFDSSHPCSR